MKISSRHLLAALLLAAGIALSQSTLGNMFRLGSSTTAGLPASSTTVKGALIYDTDVNAPKFNNGTAWQSFGGGGSSNYWTDAGFGGLQIQPDVVGHSVRLGDRSSAGVDGGVFVLESISTLSVYNWDGGSAVNLTSNETGNGPGDPRSKLLNLRNTTGGAAPAIGFWGAVGSPMYGEIFGGAGRGGSASTGMNFTSPTSASSMFQWNRTNTAPLMWLGESPTYSTTLRIVSTLAGQASFALDEGTTIDFGYNTGGSSDRLYSDNTGLVATGRLRSERLAGNNAFQSVTGALWDTGGGTNDHFLSDGTGITTPGYWASSRVYASGAGVQAASVTIASSSPANYTSAANSANGVGTLSFDITRNELLLQRTALSVQPLAPTFDRNGWHTTLVAPTAGTFVTPEIAENIIVDKTTVGMLDPANIAYLRQKTTTATGAGTTPVLLGGRTYFPMTTDTVLNDLQGSFPYAGWSSAGGAFVRALYADTQPSMCQALRTGAAITTVRITSGLVGNVAGGIPTSEHMYFYYDSGVSANWRFCARDSSAETCTDTGVAVAADTRYQLCLRVSAARGWIAWIDGVYVGASDTRVLTTASTVGPMTLIETLAASARTLNIGPYEVQQN